MRKLLVAGVMGLSAFTTNAGIIDFELDMSGNLPTDNQEILFSDLFYTDNNVGIQFGFDTTGDSNADMSAMFEQTGNKDENDDTGFWRSNGIKDLAYEGFESQLGNYFLRQSKPYSMFDTFIIRYTSDLAVTQASGEIWDIDGKPNKTEQFRVSAYNGKDLLQSIESPLGQDQSLDGKPWVFGFQNMPNITQINIDFIGSKSGMGLALNNFSPTTNQLSGSTLAASANMVNEPTSVLWVFSALLLLIIKLHKQPTIKAQK